MRVDTRRESAALPLDAFLPTMEEIADFMLARKVENILEGNGGEEAQ